MARSTRATDFVYCFRGCQVMVVNIHSQRYIKARIARYFQSKIINTAFFALSISSLITGLIFIFTGNSLGWLLCIPVVIFLMLREWYHYDLQVLPPKAPSVEFVDVLNPNILAKLSSAELDLQSLISVIQKNSGSIFFNNRFLVDQSLLATAQITDISTTLQLATELWDKFKTKNGVDGAHIAVAIIISAENKTELLKSVNYSEQEILDGLSWYAYLIATLDEIKHKKSSGGIARDWASGYTPTLNRYAQNISYQIQYGGMTHRGTNSRQKVVSEMVSIFSSAGRANVALVGRLGSGKHICVQGLANELLHGAVPGKLKYAQIFQVDVTSLLSTVGKTKIEGVLGQIMGEAYHAKNIILFFDNAGQLFGSDDQLDLTNFLQPIIQAGRLRSVFSFTDVQWQYLQTNKPAIGAVFNHQAVLPTNEAETMSILENEALYVEHKFDCVFTYASLKEIYRLAGRYGPEVAMPAKAISVMESAARTGSGGIIMPQTVQNTIENSTGIKTGLATGDEKSKLLNLEAEIQQKVIGQDSAISAVVSALKRNRSGVSNSNKPIGTFLFLGPTGVGKTELSKTLAKAYFGDEARLVRLDMNEFINKDSVNRLLAVGNQKSPTFIDKIKLQPFSVVLLDEIEKANPDIVNIFLQVLDEGILIDESNQEVSLRDTIIIATSNAGADYIREQVQSNEDALKHPDELIDQLIANNIFKPEFLNRFDETILFKPLSQKQLDSVVGVLLQQINNELSARKITVKLTEDAVQWLSANGYDPKMGARPLRRIMQKTIETIVADKILSGEVAEGDEVTVTGDMLTGYSPKG